MVTREAARMSSSSLPVEQMKEETLYVYLPQPQPILQPQGLTQVSYFDCQGSGVGLPLAGSLEDTYKGMWVQGVGGAYTASVGGNFEALGTTQEAIDQAKNLFTVAYDKCPSSAVVAGGYRYEFHPNVSHGRIMTDWDSPISQGSAVIAAALSQLKSESSIQDQVAGAVLFGYSMNKENDGKIPDFPEEKTRVYCNKTDLLCKGLLIILPSHYMYKGDATGDAPKFLEGRIEEADKGGWWD